MKVLIIVFSTCLIFLLSGCGQSVGSDVGSDVERYNPELDKDCTRCDLRGADLVLADLTGANLADADLDGANLDGFIGPDFSGALNVSPKYLKD